MQPEYVPVWMRKPIPLLDDDKPMDVVAAGGYRRARACSPGSRPAAPSESLDVDLIAVDAIRPPRRVDAPPVVPRGMCT